MAKLAEDNWVTAMAWRQQIAANNASPEGPTDISDRWMSARATARQARRINSSGSGGDLAVTSAATAYRNPASALSPGGGRSGAAGIGGGGGSGWERPTPVVVVGDADSERRSQEAAAEEEPRATLAPGRQSGAFSL